MSMASGSEPLIGVVMGSRSDWDTMQHAADILARLGVPVATFAIGAAGAANAGVFAASLLAAEHADVRAALATFRAQQTQDVLARPDPRDP